MLSLTKHEKWVLIFLSFLILVGLGTRYAQRFWGGKESLSISTAFSKKNTINTMPVMRTNINTADFNELIKIKGIGPKTAESIIEYRAINGPFFYVEDIQKVKGIGPRKFEDIKKWIITK